MTVDWNRNRLSKLVAALADHIGLNLQRGESRTARCNRRVRNRSAKVIGKALKLRLCHPLWILASGTQQAVVVEAVHAGSRLGLRERDAEINPGDAYAEGPTVRQHAQRLHLCLRTERGAQCRTVLSEVVGTTGGLQCELRTGSRGTHTAPGAPSQSSANGAQPSAAHQLASGASLASPVGRAARVVLLTSRQEALLPSSLPTPPVFASVA